MPLTNRLGFRRRNSANVTMDDFSEDDCDLDVFNPFDQSDMGITSDGKPTTFFSSMSAYTVVDCPRMTMDDFLKKPPRASADGRQPQAHHVVTFDTDTSKSPRLADRLSFCSDAAASSLHRSSKDDEAATTNNGRSRASQRGLEAVPRPESFSSFQKEPRSRSHSPLGQEPPEDTKSTVNQATFNMPRRSQNIILPKSNELGTQARRSPKARYEDIWAYKEVQEDNATLHSLPNSTPTGAVPSFQRIAGYKFELAEGATAKPSIPKSDLMCIPHLPSRAIKPRIPGRITDKFTPMKTTDVHKTSEKCKELELRRRKSELVPVNIKRKDPERRNEEMTNAAIKRWAFWSALNRTGHNGKRNPKVDFATRTLSDESERSIDEDRTEDFRSIEGADEATRTRILDGHVEQIMKVARVSYKDSAAQKPVTVVDAEPRREYSRSEMMDSASEEVIIPARVPENAHHVNREDVSTTERQKPVGLFQDFRRWFKD
ncbi:hypothetical protein BKA65DRAFT_557988 [Rhexocercosporidium sp. MPI-PUGE-AT-0058]|nr:hypothetical protein BKA65DRAFT_557988 [Rhexocercosporidium sp. MPI-PUGE-AT-0058]